MKRLDQQTIDFTDEYIDNIAKMFPHCVTEMEDETGKLKKAIDFDLLRQELSDNIVEGPKERYRLDWPGKRASLVAANTPITKTLRPAVKESENFDTTKNLYIEGDNLEALKLLQESYLGAVKMIYIDPPYNTGKDFVYKDNFTRSKEEELQESGQIDEKGGRLVANLESNGRFHSDWLSMMYPRLRLARNLLRDDGVIFISIDDNEVHNLRKICDEVFGEENFFSSLVVIRAEGGGLAKKVIKGHDYLLAYTKNSKTFQGIYRPKDVRGEIIEKDGKKYWIEEDWLRKEFGKYGTCTYEELEKVKGLKKKQEIDEGLKKGIYKLIKKGNSHIVGRLRELDKDGSKFYSILKHLNKNGVQDLKQLNLDKYFDFPKPVSLIKELVLGATFFSRSNNDVILDFYSGSATTAHAVMQLNAEDGGNRKFIMVQLPEETDEKSEAYKTIAEIGKERIRRAGKKILEDLEAKIKNEKDENEKKRLHEIKSSLDTGFRVLKIDSSNMRDVYFTPDALDKESLFSTIDHIKEDRTPEDLLFGVLVDWGVDLTLPIRREEIMGKTVFFVGHDDLTACFDDDLDIDFIKALAGREALRVVFKESGFKDDETKINAEQIFKQLSPGTDLRVI